MSSPSPTVLFFTHPEYGQANVILATSYELALAGVNVCIASFPSLEPRITRLQELVVRHRNTADPNSHSISFHECKGFLSFMECMAKAGMDISTCAHPHGISSALKCYSNLEFACFPWSPEEHLRAIEKTKGMITAIKPDLVVIDTFFSAAMDACKLAGQNFAIILPNSIKDVAVNLQPRLTASWKYPVVGSGFPFPLKLWQIPINIYLYIRLSMHMFMSTKVRHIQALRRFLGIQPTFTLDFHPGVTHVCATLPEIDFPLSLIPKEMVLCGPIILPFDPLEENDPALKTWLDKAPTVIVNLGSHVLSDETLAREIANALRILLEYHDRRGAGEIQVLWKAKPDGDILKTMRAVIGKEIDQGRIKVVAWLDADPVSILQHPNLVCTVHHGGANSFSEGVWSGVPHIVLPVWVDTYDYAVRAEFLNIGIFGSKRSAPGVQAEELSDALVRVTADTEEARLFRSSARRLKTVCESKGEGRKLAAEAILKKLGIAR